MQGVAITQENSLLDNTARIEGWLARFPMFDWVGGRTSELSAVGLLPAALQVGHLTSHFYSNSLFTYHTFNHFKGSKLLNTILERRIFHVPLTSFRNSSEMGRLV